MTCSNVCLNSITLSSKMGTEPGSKDRDETPFQAVTMSPKYNDGRLQQSGQLVS